MRGFFSQFWPTLAVAVIAMIPPFLFDLLTKEENIIIADSKYIDHSISEDLVRKTFPKVKEDIYPIRNISIHCFRNISDTKISNLQLNFQGFDRIESVKFVTDSSTVIREIDLSSKEFRGYADVATFSPFGTICTHVLSRGIGFSRILLTGEGIDVREPSNVKLFYQIVKYKFSIFDILIWICVSNVMVLWTINFLTCKKKAQTKLGE
ncbi:MAG: hypothetical protein ACK5SX_03675 [Sandaracinobacter sp.]